MTAGAGTTAGDGEELGELADVTAEEARAFLSTVTEVAAGSNPEQALPLLLLAVSDVLAIGARLGATTDVVPPSRFEPDAGPDPDVDPLRTGLANVFEGVDEYLEVVDPLLAPEVAAATVSGALASVAQALATGLAHHAEGRPVEALWWWQFSYLSDWGDRASSVLRALQTMLAHLRLDVDDDVAAEAEYDALQR
ncbi:DUF5063 domain-containing protein [Cellulomonas marina]|uniref:DUF5063 domain-containing protein n=1 Tax=Cellulomonas marina TaxID=988821 RepID=UPI000B8010E9